MTKATDLSVQGHDGKRGLPDSDAPKRSRKLRSHGAARRQVMPESRALVAQTD